LRLKKDEFVEVENNVWQELDGLGLEPGISLFLEGVKVTKQTNWVSILPVSGNVNLGNWHPKKDGLFSPTKNLELALAAYKKRFDIEQMFRDFKSGGYNLEDTNVSDNRFISLVLIISFA